MLWLCEIKCKSPRAGYKQEGGFGLIRLISRGANVCCVCCYQAMKEAQRQVGSSPVRCDAECSTAVAFGATPCAVLTQRTALPGGREGARARARRQGTSPLSSYARPTRALRHVRYQHSACPAAAPKCLPSSHAMSGTDLGGYRPTHALCAVKY
eukprot:1694746-Rhodomonas_salina.5